MPIIIFLLIISLQQVFAQSTESGNLFTQVSAIIADMPGDSGNDYQAPTPLQMQSWVHLLDELLTGNFQAAADTAAVLEYELVAYTDTGISPNRLHYVLRAIGTNYWGTYIYNPDHCRPLVIQAPHPKFDFNTGKEAFHVFRETEAFFFCMSGTHRCNQDEYTTCSGSTSVCGSNGEAYRISDLAHTAQSIFQKTTEKIFTEYSDSYFIQLHGFAKLETDPYVILSNGTRGIPALDYLVTFRENLYVEDPILTFKVAHEDFDWDRLIGFKNTQGRYINLSSAPCTLDADNTAGRFFHIEQEKTRLRANIAGWNKVANALMITFDCIPSSTNAVPQSKASNNWTIFPNPTQGIFTLLGKESLPQKIKLYNTLGKEIKVKAQQQSSKSIRIEMTHFPKGIYFLHTGNQILKLINP